VDGAVRVCSRFGRLQRREDDRRRDAMREAGWIVIVFSADDIFKHREATAERIRRALREAAAAA